jgi:hypothetical protein
MLAVNQRNYGFAVINDPPVKRIKRLCSGKLRSASISKGYGFSIGARVCPWLANVDFAAF